MKSYCFLICVFLFAALTLNAQNIDAKKAYVGFEINILAFQKITGYFSDVQGTFILDKQNLKNSIIDFNVDVASVHTHKEKYKTHLRDDKFFYFEEHPKIYFKADSVVNFECGYKAFGLLTLNGESKKIEVDLNVTEDNILGETKILRNDFRIASETYPRSFPVHESILLQINYSMN